MYVCSEDTAVRTRLTECIETILNKATEPPKSKKVQHSNAKNAVLFEAINLVIHMDCDSALLVRAANQLGQFLQHRETNLRYVCSSCLSVCLSISLSLVCVSHCWLLSQFAIDALLNLLPLLHPEYSCAGTWRWRVCACWLHLSFHMKPSRNIRTLSSLLSRYISSITIRYDTIRDAILTCARKPT